METIVINWNSEKSIKEAEKRKKQLENKGYTLFSQTNNTLIYKK